VLKRERIQITTAREEAIGVTLPQVKIANNRYCCSSTATLKA